MTTFNIVYFATLILGLAITIYYIVIRDKKPKLKHAIIKTISSMFFVKLIVLTNYKLNLGIVNFVTFGAFCAVLGDIFLDFKYVYSNDADNFLFAGMTSFSFCHLFYIITLSYFILTSGVAVSYLLIPLAITLFLVLIGNFIITKVLKIQLGKFKLMSLLYLSFLIGTLIFSIFTIINFKHYSFSIIFMIGALMFLLSDLVLTKTYFENKDSKIYIVSNHILYYLAQYLIAFSFYFLI